MCLLFGLLITDPCRFNITTQALLHGSKFQPKDRSTTFEVDDLLSFCYEKKKMNVYLQYVRWPPLLEVNLTN